MVACVTAQYMVKISDKTGKDNCGIEYDMGILKLGRSRVIPVVMESSMRVSVRQRRERKKNKRTEVFTDL